MKIHRDVIYWAGIVGLFGICLYFLYLEITNPELTRVQTVMLALNNFKSLLEASKNK